MGILSRMGEIMSANINALIDSWENPEKMIDQTLRRMNEDKATVKKETAAIMAEEQAAKRRVDELTKSIAEYDQAINNAALQGKREDGIKLVELQDQVRAQLQTATQTYEIAKANSENMQKMYEKLSSDIAVLEGKRANIKAQLKMANAQERVNDVTSRMNNSNATDTFNRMADKAQSRLDQAVAQSKLEAATNPNEDLKNKYMASSGGSAADRFDAIMAAAKGDN